MEAEQTGCWVDAVDHLNRQSTKLVIIRDAMAAQEETEGWFFIIDDMIREAESVKDKISLLHLRLPENRKGGR
jgi:hypothetical protein